VLSLVNNFIICKLTGPRVVSLLRQTVSGIDEALRDKTRAAVEQVRELSARDVLPPPSPPELRHRCHGCSLAPDLGVSVPRWPPCDPACRRTQIYAARRNLRTLTKGARGWYRVSPSRARPTGIGVVR
jgi:hypothetical protein